MYDNFSWRSWFVSEGKLGVTYVCLRCVVSSLSVVRPSLIGVK